MSQKILVIDDNLAASKLTESVLAQNFGATDVLLAQRGSDAFERFHVAQPDLILMNETLPDMDGETLCGRLLGDPFTARVPVIVMASNGRADAFDRRFENVVSVLPKPITPESLLDVVTTALSQAKVKNAGARTAPQYDAARATFSGHTGFFSLRSALQMACGDRLTGVLRFFIARSPIELFISKGRFLFATTRNSQLYCRESPVILSSTNLGTLMEAQLTQSTSGCPLFLSLSMRGGFAHDDVLQITRDHGQRAFANLWTAGRVNFAFEETTEFPEFAKNFPPSPEDADNWVLASLRFVRFESLMASQRPDPNGSPAYTRKGYELIQRLKLNDVEARFATAINGAESLQVIAQKVGIPLNDALLIVFRFNALDIIDFWNSSVLSLPGGPGSTSGAT